MRSTEKPTYVSYFFKHNLGRYTQISDMVEKICVTVNERESINRVYLDLKFDFIVNDDFKVDDETEKLFENWDNELSIYVGNTKELKGFDLINAKHNAKIDIDNITDLFETFTDKLVFEEPKNDDKIAHFEVLLTLVNKFSLFK